METSVPAGAVITSPAVRLLPLTVNVLAVPAVPTVVEPRSRVPGVTVIVATAAAFTVPVTVTSCSVAPVLVEATLPLMAPAVAVLAMRVEMVVLATVPVVGVNVMVAW